MKSILYIACLASLVACTVGSAEPVPINPEPAALAKCDDPLLDSVARPTLGDDDSERFNYWFRHRPAQGDAPTVVFLPGGPGNESIGSDASLFVPAEFGLVQTDPRGVGCNELPAIADPLRMFRTEEIARDVVAMIEQLELDDYVVFGHSYGTLLATVVAHFLESADVAPPRAVIVEGVLGRAFTDEFPGQAYIDIWNQLRGVLPQDALDLLASDEPLGLSEEQWGKYFMAQMPRGSTAEGNALLNLLFLLSEDAVAGTGRTLEENRQLVRNDVLAIFDLDVVSPAGLELQRHVACREITDAIPEDNIDVVLRGGELVPSPQEGTLCEGLPLTEPFDVIDYPSSAETFYFLGALDPATPVSQGVYHFQNHTQAPRALMVAQAAGHLPLHFNLATDPTPCALALVEAIGRGEPVEPALATCQRNVTLERLPAGE